MRPRAVAPREVACDQNVSPVATSSSPSTRCPLPTCREAAWSKSLPTASPTDPAALAGNATLDAAPLLDEARFRPMPEAPFSATRFIHTW